MTPDEFRQAADAGMRMAINGWLLGFVSGGALGFLLAWQICQDKIKALRREKRKKAGN